MNFCPYVICRVERQFLVPVQQVDSLETAYGHLSQLQKKRPGDTLILEHKAGEEVRGRADLELEAQGSPQTPFWPLTYTLPGLGGSSELRRYVWRFRAQQNV